MCKGNKKCAKCMAADGGDKSYNPREVAGWINKHVYNGKATTEELKKAYTPVMVWLESKKLSFTGESISDNKDELRVVINDPNYLSDKNEERSGWRLAILFIIFVVICYYLFKDTPSGMGAPAVGPAPIAPPPVAPAPVAPPVAPVPPVAPLTPA